VAHAAALLLAHGHGPANSLALAYRANLQGRGHEAATINRRLAALRSLVKIARTQRAASAVEEANVTSQGYRDTRGPGDAGYRRLLDVLDRRRGPLRALPATSAALANGVGPGPRARPVRLHLATSITMRRKPHLIIDIDKALSVAGMRQPRTGDNVGAAAASVPPVITRQRNAGHVDRGI